MVCPSFADPHAVILSGEKISAKNWVIATVLYLRLVYFPFTPMNFGMGLTKVRFTDYFIGTGLGIIVGTFIFTFFIGTLKDVWASGNWGELISFKVFGSIALFIFSFFIPKIINKIKEELLDTLRLTLKEALEMNKLEALAVAESNYSEVVLEV
ncbi:MAG: VTT domain-containing protein [Desulfobacteraceae bacterium]